MTTRTEKSLRLRAERVERAVNDRNEYVRRMRAAKASLRQIAEVAGLSHETVAKILGERSLK